MRNVTNGEALEMLDMISELLLMIQDLNENENGNRVPQRYIDSLQTRIDYLTDSLG